ncbi:regulatory protein ToxS [Vibrio porteresiae]|uniref:Regulatory protein ToxS n=1 Tax=Vibrio porteresiae DSM 19223 TaxID=1123496 RepID=A0ABZ0QCQ4_9VIBR|nr:regulatory protein ToxS [Vibrio porteresiae]WPC73306.1 regulatory protein ToxS [Vibrio porteresiae DSM 19223]
MTKRIATIIFLISLIFSAWLYLDSDLKVEQLLSSREWQSRIVTKLESDRSVGPLTRVDVSSNMKYLPNGNYIRVSVMRLFAQQSKEPDSVINISETGDWDVSDNYLLVTPKQFKDVSNSKSSDFTPDQLKLITQFFKLDAEQSRRIDIVNDKTLLLTSLSHGSQVLFSN